MSDAPSTLHAAWRGVRRVLAVRLDNLGDVLMTTPALAALRQALPQAHLALLASPSARALQPHLDVNELIAFPAPWVAGAGSDDARATADEREVLQRIAAHRFDAAVVFTVCTQSALPAALMCRWAGIPLRLAHARENPYRLLTHWVRDDERPVTGMRHEVQRQLDLVASIGAAPPSDGTGLRFARRAADEAALAAWLQDKDIGADEPLVLVHPGATAESRRWPAPRFGRAAARVAEAIGARVVLSGAAGDASAVALAAAEVPGALTLLSPSLGLLAGLTARARVVLCNNSLPAHLAAALGTPVVVAYALTNPQHTPWQARSRVLSHDVPCRWCLKSVCPEGHHACLQGVEADEMAAAALSLLDPQVVPA